MPPSLNIRKFIASRRPSDEDINGFDVRRADSPPVPFRILGTDQDSNDNSHGANSRSFHRRRAPSPVIVMGSHTHSDISRPLPPLPRETPRSSSSSSGTYERHSESDYSATNKGSNSTPSKEGSEGSTLISCVDTSNPDDTLTQRVPKSRFQLFNNVQSKEEAIPALSSEEENKGVSQELSEDGQQFMQEAEEAFKVIGGTLSEVHPEERTSSDIAIKPSSLETPRESDPTPPVPPPKGTSPTPKLQSPSRIPPIFSSTLGGTPKATPPTKPRRRKSNKTSRKPRSMRSQRRPTAPKQAVKTGTRWGLSENVSELLTGKLFQKIEADEMLTPAQIQEYKRRRMVQVHAEKQPEAPRESLIITPTEPFHLEDLHSRILAAGVNTDAGEPPSVAPPAIPTSGKLPQRKSSLEGQKQAPVQRPVSHQNITVATTSSRTLKPPPRRRMSELPAIAEASPILRSDDGLLGNNNSAESPANDSDSDYIFFRSSSRSIMTPNFRHGPIRLSKADLLPDVRLGGDEVLDWTAFQMAILGGAGDWFSEGENTQRQEDEAEIDDIVEWWDSWHFGSTDDAASYDYRGPPSPASTLSGDTFLGDSVLDLAYSEIENYHTGPPYRWPSRSDSRTPGLRVDLDFARSAMHTPPNYYAGDHANANPSHPWRRESLPKHVASNRESVNSLPPSPMLDLRVHGNGTGDELDVVPMGYNLGHDLGDFLRWEAEHAYGGFTSPGGVR
ncbi:hypothetical protein F4861DRAFT_359052 [Xylaria intraflava]|nr:hypothetical protein F4861DRAFT_359052 [Xylaria intraflava]